MPSPGDTRVLTWSSLSPDEPQGQGRGIEEYESSSDQLGGTLEWDRVLYKVKRQPPEVLEALNRALSDIEQADPLDPDRWGPAPGPEGHFRAARTAAMRIARFRSSVIADAETTLETAGRLDTDTTDVERRLNTGELVAIEQDGRTLLPRWQFRDESPGTALPGLARVCAAFPGDGFALSGWMVEPNDALGGATPRACLEAGEVDSVVAAAESIGA